MLFTSNPPIQAIGTAEYGVDEGSEVALGAPEIILRFPTAKISLRMPVFLKSLGGRSGVIK